MLIPLRGTPPPPPSSSGVVTIAGDRYQGDIGESVQVYQYHIVLNKRVQVQVQVDFWTWKGPEGECFWIQGYSEEGVSDGIY